MQAILSEYRKPSQEKETEDGKHKADRSTHYGGSSADYEMNNNVSRPKTSQFEKHKKNGPMTTGKLMQPGSEQHLLDMQMKGDEMGCVFCCANPAQ